MNLSTKSTSDQQTKKAKTIPLTAADDSTLEKISREGLLSLTLAEMKTIQAYFSDLKRDPTDMELETLAQTWSEHCVHKTFKAAFDYTEENLGRQPSLSSKSYENLLKETIVQATEKQAHPWCLSVFKDNAGVIEFDEENAVSFKVETHNHPSALEPYGGAMTGIGGVIRDILGCGLGGKPILNTDVFCFGPLDTPEDEIPSGALHPERIAHGVISGVRDYGNRMGIPTTNGAIYFDKGYIGNPLVFCGTVGTLPKASIDKTVKPGDLVVVVGGRTGRDGIHGATFSSAPLESGITSNVVQIGHAIMEKKFLDVLLQARDKGLYRSLTDCGAGGFSSAIGELGEETGVKVQIELAPLKYKGLEPWEIWLSESQERMVLAVPPDKWPLLRNLFQQEDVEAVSVGEFTDDKKLVVHYKEQTVAELDMHFLHKGLPKLSLKAEWNPKNYFEKHKTKSNLSDLSFSGTNSEIGEVIKKLLQHPIIASKETVVRQYDHEVQGGTVIKPFMGVEYDGPTDACVIRPKLTSWRGIAVSNGLNPEVGKYDPYLMAQMAVDEAYRNLICVGGGLKNVAILDNFCWGDAKDSLEMGALVRAAEGAKEAAMAYDLPFISGKDSFNNTWKSPDGKLQSIPATLLVSAIGVVEDIRKCLSSGLKEAGNLIYLVGDDSEKLGGSLAAQLIKNLKPLYPEMDLNGAAPLYKKLQSAMKFKNVASAHDISDGGIALCGIEMAFGGLKGLDLKIPADVKSPFAYLLSEAPSRFLVEVLPDKKVEFEESLGARNFYPLGSVIHQREIKFSQGSTVLFHEELGILKNLWKEPLKSL